MSPERPLKTQFGIYLARLRAAHFRCAHMHMAMTLQQHTAKWDELDIFDQC
jgi:hypothetical protein